MYVLWYRIIIIIISFSNPISPIPFSRPIALFTPSNPDHFPESTYKIREHMTISLLQSSSRSAIAATTPNTAIPLQGEVCLAAAAFEVLVPTILFPGPQFCPKHTPGVEAIAPGAANVVGVAVIRKPC